jgi:hypothetical protein
MLANDLRERFPRFEFFIQAVRILSLLGRGSYWYLCQCSRLPIATTVRAVTPSFLQHNSYEFGSRLGSIPSWKDFLRLAFDEVRVYGATSVQVMRRMGARQ